MSKMDVHNRSTQRMYWYTTYMLLQSKAAVKKTVCSESRLVSFGASSCEFNNWLFLLFLLVLAMNWTKSKEVYSIQRFVHPSLEPIAVGSTLQRSRSFMDRDFLAASSSNDISANSHALGVSLTPAGWKLRSHAGLRLRANFSRLIEKCELQCRSQTKRPTEAGGSC